MPVTGRATIYGGTTGTITHTGAAINVSVASYSDSDEAQVTENTDGVGELNGFYTKDKRRRCTIEFYPNAATIADAKAALKYPEIPSKVTLSGFLDTSPASLDIDGDWIYSGGASRVLSGEQARYTIPLFKPKTSAYTVAQLVALAT